MKRARKLLRQWAPLGVALAICAWASIGIIYSRKHQNISSVPAVAVTLEKACKGDAANDLKCQQSYYKTRYETEGLKTAFVDLRRDYEVIPSVKSNCHQLTHAIGRAAAAEHGDVAKAYADGDEFCWSGYYHGVMEGILQKLGNASVADSLNTICQSLKDKSAYSFDHYNCAHGLGHGIMLIEGDELFVSLKSCDNLQDPWERESCYGGVFMENIMAHSNPDHNTKYVKDDDPLYPCTDVEVQYRNQCYGMQTSHALTVLSRDYNKVFSLCSQIEAVNQATCYQSLGRDASGDSISDVEKTYAICIQGPSYEAQKNCVIGAVKDFISYHHSDAQAGVLCSKFETELASVCTTTKQEYYNQF